MKTTLFILMILLMGCSDVPVNQKEKKAEHEYRDSYNHVFKITLEGHEYWLFEGYSKGGIIHSESCPCKNKSK
jgi:hypothetical protein